MASIKTTINCMIVLCFHPIMSTCSYCFKHACGWVANFYHFIIQNYGITALAYAANQGHEQVVDVLLKAGANPDIQDQNVCDSFLVMNKNQYF